MTHKLNLTWLPEPVKHQPPDDTGYKSPIGTWQVTTEGDCEGRSTTNLGVWYGHVAEIAFHLADKCYYKLSFRPLKMHAANDSEKFTGKRKSVNIGFEPGFLPGPGAFYGYGNEIKGREDIVAKWLNADGVGVKPCSYYGAVTLVFND